MCDSKTNKKRDSHRRELLRLGTVFILVVVASILSGCAEASKAGAPAPAPIAPIVPPTQPIDPASGLTRYFEQSVRISNSNVFRTFLRQELRSQYGWECDNFCDDRMDNMFYLRLQIPLQGQTGGFVELWLYEDSGQPVYVYDYYGQSTHARLSFRGDFFPDGENNLVMLTYGFSGTFELMLLNGWQDPEQRFVDFRMSFGPETASATNPVFASGRLQGRSY